MTEIEIARLPAHRALFHGPEMDLLIGAVLAGNAAARCWVSAGGVWALLWDRCNNVLYLGGRVPPEGRESLAALLQDQVHTATVRGGRPYLRGRGTDEANTLVLEEVLAAFRPVRDPFRFYAYRAPACDPLPARDRIQVLPVTQPFLEEQRPGTDAVEEELLQMWPSLAVFYEKGFAFAAVADGAVVCWCTTEYMSGDRCGIGIATDPALRRQGIGTLTAAACVAESLRRQVTPYWFCAARNLPSVRLAEKLGFELLEESEFLHWKATS